MTNANVKLRDINFHYVLFERLTDGCRYCGHTDTGHGFDYSYEVDGQPAFKATCTGRGCGGSDDPEVKGTCLIVREDQIWKFVPDALDQLPP